ncbi:hypothetical protein Pcinc_012393 [Petrolisthes cinctipes]|uniref:Uncharacterized protein n=1 Tax=Petrolisthes cinctipes TaxID=88211 RepID=A0AAE1FZ17_PETCI|nr:hypothetical protein Pcinc_012393 [Petrolisthes cinctipes]
MLKELTATHHSPSGLVSQKGRVAIVTGSGRGIGLETVKQFLQLDMTVVVAGRHVPFLEASVAGLRDAGLTGGEARCMELDLTSMASVRKFAADFLALRCPLQILVNNAGIMFWPRELTEDGNEAHWSVNYLGHFLLTHLLLPCLKANRPTTTTISSRVVNLTSSVHYIGSINFEDPNSKQHYNPQAAYAQSKLAQMMFTITLDELVSDQGVMVNAVHPGVVATQLFQHVAWATYFPWLARTFLKTPRQGCDTVVYCSLSPNVTHGGGYYENCTPTAPATYATRKELRDQLWKLSCQQLGIKVFGEEE